MSTSAQQKRHALIFWENHGLKATMDYANVSRRTLYRWQQTLAQAGGDPATLTPRSRAPKCRRQAVFRRELVDEIRRLRKVRPNIGKLPLSVLIKTWCQTHKCPRPSVSTIGRIIDREPDKMRHAPLRLDRRGRHKPLRQTRKTRRPKGISTAPMEQPWSASVMASDATSSPSSTPARASPSPGRPPPVVAAAPHTPCAPSSP